MRKIDMVQCLIADAAEEIKKFEVWRDAKKNGPVPLNMEQPNRQRVLDDLKMARRLSLEVEKEVRPAYEQ